LSINTIFHPQILATLFSKEVRALSGNEKFLTINSWTVITPYYHRTLLAGGMAEWFKAAVLKTVVPRGTVGSNPTPSARKFIRAMG
jgi:hypothetical protein